MLFFKLAEKMKLQMLRLLQYREKRHKNTSKINTKTASKKRREKDQIFVFTLEIASLDGTYKRTSGRKMVLLRFAILGFGLSPAYRLPHETLWLYRLCRKSDMVRV